MNLSDTTTNTTKVKTMKLPTIYKRRLTAVVLVASVTLGLAACSTASAAGRSSASDTVNRFPAAVSAEASTMPKACISPVNIPTSYRINPPMLSPV